MNTDLRRTFSPPRDRFVSIHRARKKVRFKELIPPQSPDLEGMTDLHLHCSTGYQNEAFATVQFAARCGMKGLMMKTYKQMKNPYTARDVAELQTRLDAWCSAEGLKAPVIKAGYIYCHAPKEPDLKLLKQNLDEGVQGVWFPFANALRSYMVIGPQPDSLPLSREEALAKGGLIIIDDNGELKPEFKGAIELIAEYDRSLHFGHRFHEEIYAAAKYGQQCGITRMIVDHPFSPFIDMTWEAMRTLIDYGVKFNFTYNEISPVGGVDPQDVADTIREIGVQHFTLSSDAGDYLFPSSVECVRLLHETLRCYGLTDEDIRIAGSVNGSYILGLPD